MEYVHKKVSSTSLKNKSLSRNYTFETLHFTAQPSIKHGFESKRETFANKFQASFFLSEFSITARCRSYASSSPLLEFSNHKPGAKNSTFE